MHARWRWNYFSGFNGRSRGFQTPLGRASFIRSARWDTGRLAGPDGQDGPRSLDVYIAHEVTHMMVADRIGLMAGRRLPVWLREGYAEYVARHDTFEIFQQPRNNSVIGGGARNVGKQNAKLRARVDQFAQRS